ncbi:host cell division inhibitor Icd-like protein [Phytobacter ursingii]
MIAHKTKAAMPGRLSHNALLKHHHITRLAAGGQTLRVTISPAQTLSRRNSHAQIKLGDLPSLNNRVRLTYGHRNPLNHFNYRELRESANPLNGLDYNDSLEPVNSLIIPKTCNAGKMMPFLYHEENQQHQVLDDENWLSLSEPVDRPSLRGPVNGITGSNPVQLSGSDLAFLRCLRLISFSKAVTTNCPVLSPSIFNNSTDSATWCGTRTSNLFDFALMDLVAITQVLVIRCPTMIYEKKAKATLDVSDTRKYYVSDTLILLKCKNSEARQCWSTNRASDQKPLSEVTVMAELQHTQTRPKYQYRFLALSSIGRNVIHITATTEREAREQSPAGCVMVFAGRLPVQEVRHA